MRGKQCKEAVEDGFLHLLFLRGGLLGFAFGLFNAAYHVHELHGIDVGVAGHHKGMRGEILPQLLIDGLLKLIDDLLVHAVGAFGKCRRAAG